MQDPGQQPTSVTSVTYSPLEIAPWNGNTGGTRTKVPKIEITAYFDCGTGKWKCKVTKAESEYETFSRRPNSASEASVSAASSSAILCRMEKDLAGLGYNGDEQWFMLSAVQEHEKVHAEQWKTAFNAEFQTMKSTVEGIEAEHKCGETPQDGKSKIEGGDTYKNAIYDVYQKAKDAYGKNPDRSQETDDAERSVLNPMINSLEQKRTTNQWAACQ